MAMRTSLPIDRRSMGTVQTSTLPVTWRTAQSPAGPVVSRRKSMGELCSFELEPEVRDWLDSLSDSDYKRVDEVCGLLAEKGSELGGPWSDHLDGPVWELGFRLRDVAARVTYSCIADGKIVLLTVVPQDPAARAEADRPGRPRAEDLRTRPPRPRDGDL